MPIFLQCAGSCVPRWKQLMFKLFTWNLALSSVTGNWEPRTQGSQREGWGRGAATLMTAGDNNHSEIGQQTRTVPGVVGGRRQILCTTLRWDRTEHGLAPGVLIHLSHLK